MGKFVMDSGGQNYNLAHVREIFPRINYIQPEVYNTVSRYVGTRRIRDDETKRIYHETYNAYSIPMSSDDVYYTVDLTTKNRLDYISFKFYQTSIYYWVVAMANDIIDPFNIPVDTVLRIPPLKSLYGTKGILNNPWI